MDCCSTTALYFSIEDPCHPPESFVEADDFLGGFGSHLDRAPPAGVGSDQRAERSSARVAADDFQVLHDEGVDLPRWACSMVKEEWTSEVLDTELLRHLGAEEEMVEMLRLAMDCTEPAPDQRPAMPEIVARIEGLGGTASASTTRSCRSAAEDHRIDPSELG